MSNKEARSKPDMVPSERMAAVLKPVGVARLEMHKGSLTKTHRHETECLLVVLKGVCRVYLQEQAITVRESQMLNIPPHHEHVAEALADAVVLSISASASEWTGCGPVLQNDADQYLWGV